MQFFLIEISLLTKIRAPGGHIQITIMIDTQQQYEEAKRTESYRVGSHTIERIM
jgi:hypothetical protein